MRVRCKRIIEKIRAATGPDGQLLSPTFERLPTSKELPYYYQVIPSPVDLKSVQHALGKPHYSLYEFTIDMALVFTNAQLFNEEGSTRGRLARSKGGVCFCICRDGGRETLL